LLGHVPLFYVDASAFIALAAAVIRLATWGTHRTLAALRDIRRYRRGE
jgi:hypothetical protein